MCKRLDMKTFFCLVAMFVLVAMITVLLNQNVLYSRICTKCTETICHQMYRQTRRTHTEKFMSLTQLRLTAMCLLWFVIMVHGPQHLFDSQHKSR
jgi:hypothetical protein